MDNQFNNDGGEQNIAQGDHPIGKQVNNYGIPPEVFAQYVRDLGVTDSAFTSFFKILEQEQVPLGDLDSKLREIAFRHKELLLRFESVQSDDPEVRSLKVQAKDAIEDGRFDDAEELLSQARERDRAAVAKLKESIAEQQVSLEKRQFSEAKSCVEQAQLQEMQYRYAKAAEYWREAADVLPENCKTERAKYLGAAGYGFYCIDSYVKAMHFYEQSLSISHEIGDHEGEGMMLNNISQIYKPHPYGIALDYLKQSLHIRQAIGDKWGESTTLNNIGTIYLIKGNYPNALKYLKQSLVLCRQVYDTEGEGVTLNNIGQIYHREGDCPAALQYYNQALVISRACKDKATESNVLNNLSLVYQAQGKFDAALKQLGQSLVIAQQIGNRQGEAITLNNIGMIYQDKEDYTAALKYHEQSLVIVQEIGHKEGDMGTSRNIGLLYAKQGQLAQSEPYLSRAVELAEQLEHPKLKDWRTELEEVRAKLR